VGTAFGPLHLLTLGEALADDGVHRAFGQAGGDALAGAVSLAIVDQAASVAGDVDGELMGGTHEFAEVRIVHLQPAHVILEERDLLAGPVLVAVP